jgi:hypothetical protein
MKNMYRHMVAGSFFSAIFFSAIFFCVAGAATDAWAQNGGGALPFSNTYRRPSVSPMTMLGTGVGAGFEGVAGNGLVYQQLIQPRNMQEQQVITQMQQGRALSTLSGRVSEGEKRVTARFDQTIRPTGHAATYMNMSHYYPR